MQNEWINVNRKETAIKVRNTKIEAVRKKNILSKGVRVYNDGCIGVSGCMGDTSDDTLLAQAKDNLSVGIKYPYDLEQQKEEHRDYAKQVMTPDELYDYVDAILKIMRSDYPQFDFSETASVYEVSKHMKNSLGLDLSYHDCYLELGLILKDKKTSNLFDGFIVSSNRQLDAERFWQANHVMLNAYSSPVALPDADKLPVIMFNGIGFSGFLSKCLNGELYGTGSSLFSDKMDQQLLNPRIHVSQYANPETTLSPFFDTEGVTLENDTYPLISEGVLRHVYTDKRTARRFDLPHTGAAGGEYDSVPTLGGAQLQIKTDAVDLDAALGDKPAILVLISSGGDFTPDGDYAAPVQVSFLYENGKIAGKLPEFSIRSSLFKALGDDYVGTFDNTSFYLGDVKSQLLVTEMDIVT